MNAAVAVGFAAWGTKSASGDDRMIRPALGAAGASLACTMAALTSRSAKHPDQDVPVPALLAIAGSVLPSHIALPVAVALRTRWKRR
jgi:hypothetical protein